MWPKPSKGYDANVSKLRILDLAYVAAIGKVLVVRKSAALLAPTVVVVLLASIVVVVAASESAQASFPGRNGKIAFEKTPKGSRISHIFAINPDGTGRTQLTRNRRYDNYGPAWSPDGKKVLFYRMSGGGRTGEIFMMNRDGSNARRLTSNSVHDYGPSWSPDGAKIVFGSLRDGDTGIFVMDRDGSDARRLTNQPGYEPSWSPDGTEIAFFEGGDLVVVNADGSGEPRTLVSSDELHNPEFKDGVDWSPDGQRVAFSAYYIEQGSCCQRVYTVEANGTGLTVLVDEGYWSAWSPNGSKIAFTKDSGTYVKNADGTGRRTKVVNGGGSLSWQPLKENSFDRGRVSLR